MDLNANWIWGNYFYNVSYELSDITGCQLSSQGTFLMVYGQIHSKPVIMSLDKTDGSINRFLSIEIQNSAVPNPTVETFDGFLFDEVDS